MGIDLGIVIRVTWKNRNLDAEFARSDEHAYRREGDIYNETWHISSDKINSFDAASRDTNDKTNFLMKENEIGLDIESGLNSSCGNINVRLQNFLSNIL